MNRVKTKRGSQSYAYANVTTSILLSDLRFIVKHDLTSSKVLLDAWHALSQLLKRQPLPSCGKNLIFLPSSGPLPSYIAKA